MMFMIIIFFSIVCLFKVCDIKSTPREVPIKFNHLTWMVISIDVSKKDDLVAALCLFNCVPKLQDLHVEVHNEYTHSSNT